MSGKFTKYTEDQNAHGTVIGAKNITPRSMKQTMRRHKIHNQTHLFHNTSVYNMTYNDNTAFREEGS
jgi:hypothetical protein